MCRHTHGSFVVQWRHVLLFFRPPSCSRLHDCTLLPLRLYAEICPRFCVCARFVFVSDLLEFRKHREDSQGFPVFLGSPEHCMVTASRLCSSIRMVRNAALSERSLTPCWLSCVSNTAHFEAQTTFFLFFLCVCVCVVLAWSFS